LGADTGLLKRICADDKEVLDLIDQAEQGKHGGDHTSAESKFDNVNVALRPTGNARQHALRKLRKDRPDIHAQVLAEKLSSGLPCAETGM
jgi:hypothetical protein